MRVSIFISTILCLATPGTAAFAADNTADIYNLSYEAQGDIASGKAGACALTISPKGKWTLKTNTPFKAMVTGSDGVNVSKEKYTAKDFASEKTPAKTINTEFTAAKAGAGTVNANLTFFLCTDEVCKRYKADAACAFTAK